MEENKQKIPEKIKAKGMETFAEDMADVIQDASGGMIRKIIEEQEGEIKKIENLSPESRKNKTLMIIGVILIALALGTLLLLATFSKKNSTVVPLAQFTPIVYTDKSQFLEIGGLNKDQIIQSIKNAVNSTTVKKYGVEGIYMTENKKVIGFKRFIEIIGGDIPNEVLTYTNDNFLVGTWNGSSKEFFMLMKVKSFTDVFPGLKTWESKMFSDLHGFFGIEINADNKYLLTKNFDDGIVGNKNSRILHDSNGKSVLEYVFADETSVIMIANDEASKEIMLRLSATRSR